MQKCKGERQRYISRSRVSAVGSQVRVIRCGCGYGCGPEPVPEPEHLNQIPEGRDLGPEKRVLAVSGWRLAVGNTERQADASPTHPTIDTTDAEVEKSAFG